MRDAGRRLCWMAAILVAGWAAPTGVEAQLDRYDYEYLKFRGIGLEAGYVWPNKVDPVASFGGRFDFGYAGPGLRIMPGIRYWSSYLKESEVTALEDRLRQIIQEANPGEPVPAVDLGRIRWSDIVLTLDGHFVWEVPFGLLTYLGAGVSAHILNGSGTAVNDTFIEELLDRASAGVNAHAGAEYLISSSLRLYGTGKFEILDDLNYFELRGGLQFMFGSGQDERQTP